MNVVELKRRMAPGTRWKTEYLGGPFARVVENRAVDRQQSNGVWFTPEEGRDRGSFLQWPKRGCVKEETDGAITLSFEDGRAFARYWELKEQKGGD